MFDRAIRQSTFEVFSFKSVGKVSDRFLLRSPSEIEDNRDSTPGARMSLIQVNSNNDDQIEANIEQIRQRLTEHKDTSDTSNLNLLYRSLVFSGKIKGLLYCDKHDLLCVGLQSGKVETYRFEIEQQGILNDGD